jgi:hypothetical protein
MQPSPRDALLAALASHFNAGIETLGVNGARVEFQSTDWLLALCPEQTSAAAYLVAFERGMQLLIDSAAAGVGAQLGLALAFTSTETRERASYRRALKKYSNSIIFEDLGIHLLLAGRGGLEFLPPTEVNHFLRGLDRWVAAGRS